MVNISEIVRLLKSLFMVECCRGDIVIKVGNIQVESKSTTKHSTTSTPSSPAKTTSNPPSSSTKDKVNP